MRTASGSIPITLPGGYWRDGARYRDALLRPLRGADELFLAEETSALSPARRTTMLLARCVERLGDEPVSEERVRELTAGDREAILLHLRRTAFGDTVTSVLRCPREGCHEKMDLELRVTDLLVADSPHAAPVHQTTIDGEVVRFRLPNGGDLEEAAMVAASDPQGAVRRLLERCLEMPASGALPASGESELAERMSALDPQAELTLKIRCTRCERPFTALFDAAAFLYGELSAHRDSLYREVHELAFHYHWSESDILAMTPSRRRRYLELLAEALAPRGRR